MRNYTRAQNGTRLQSDIDGRRENFQYNTNLLKGKEYGVTFTLDPRKTSRYKLLSLFYASTTDICKKLSKVASKFWIYPELTPMAGRLHWHAYVKMRDPIGWDYFVNYYNSMYGTIKVEPITDLRGWQLYCEKDYIKMALMLKLYRNMIKTEDLGPEIIRKSNFKRLLSTMAPKKERQEPFYSTASILDYGIA